MEGEREGKGEREGGGGRRGGERERGGYTHTQGQRRIQRRTEVDRDGETETGIDRECWWGVVGWVGRDRDTEKRKIPHRSAFTIERGACPPVHL